ncbi:hypothetical protein J3454_14445 [Erythrobacter sp. NFXS35]|uniref:hypothetical protein n=1 Tax=Erythrobacter sp. NFXS35 TaxID=2818436 RepID=UPI0032E04855
MIIPASLAKPVFGLARWIWGLIVLAVLVLLGWWVVATLIGGSTAKTEAKLGSNQTKAALESGADAVGTIGTQGAAEDTIDATTSENANAIRSAPGADTPVPAAVDAVGRERLCKRAAYRVRPECLQHAPAD